MKYQEFIENVKEHISTQLPASHKVVLHPVLKNNSTVYDGLIILDPVLNISPTIYLNPYYHRYLSGVDMEDIYDDILKSYWDHLPKKDFDISVFTDYSKARKNILIKLINKEKNASLLQDVPHVIFHDLAIVFLCGIYNHRNEFGTILIHNQHMEHWNVTVDELYKVGMENTPKFLPFRLDSIDKILDQYEDDNILLPLDALQISLLTNKRRVNGATCMVYPTLLKRIADFFNDDLIIIPSSIHEVLIIPESIIREEYSLEDYREMITQVNEEHLPDDEMLSNHAYLFLKETEELVY